MEQQRLTTLTLLLAAIRANVKVDLRDQITKRLYERGDTFAGTADRFRLTLRERDAEFFQKYVQKESGFADLLKIETGLSDESSALQLTPPEQSLLYDQLNGPIYADLSAKARTSVLLRLDSLLSGGGATYDFDVISVEHVLPQTPKPDSQWLVWFPDSFERATLVHRLGNLALLTRRKNSAASNWDFERKKASYFLRGGVSPFVLTTQVLNVPEWSSTAVKSRQQQLMNLFTSHWRLEKRASLDEWLLRTI